MKEWFNSYSNFFQGVIIIAAVATVIMIIQIIMLLIGMGAETAFDGADIDDPSDIDDAINDNNILDVFGLKILTIRNIIAFFSVGGWSMIVFYNLTKITYLAIILGIIVGVATMFLMAYVFKKAMNLQSSGNIDLQNAKGKIATVYLTIPKEKTGKGKVNVVVQERYIEVEAVTLNEAIPTGSEVEIIDVINDYVVVEKK